MLLGIDMSLYSKFVNLFGHPRLMRGHHDKFEQNICLLELCAWFGGEAHTDFPACIPTDLAIIGRRVNDMISDDIRRTRLLAPLIPRLMGASSSAEAIRERAFIATDHSTRIILPVTIKSLLPAEVETLRLLDPIVDAETAQKAEKVLYQVGIAATAIHNSPTNNKSAHNKLITLNIIHIISNIARGAARAAFVAR